MDATAASLAGSGVAAPRSNGHKRPVPAPIDIAIVGAGPAGLSAWLHLHALAPELAARAAVFEKAEHPRFKLCGGGVTAIGDLLLGGLGLELRCPSVPVHRIEFRYGERVEVLEQANAMRVVRRREFDGALADAARARGLDLRQGEVFLAAEPEEGGLRVRTARGEHRVRALVGADGAQSAVRHALGLDDESRLARLIEIVTPVERASAPEFAGPTAVFDFGPMAHGVQGYVWHFPCVENGAAAVNRGIYDSRIHPKRERADLRAVFAAALAAAGIDAGAVEWQAAPVRWFSPAGAFARPHAFLIGDAAGVDPFLGEGIAPSLDYGDFAANLLIDAFARGDFGFASYLERLRAHPLGRLLGARGMLALRAYLEPPTQSALSAMLRLWSG